jgi:hypothetical protein
LIANFGLHNSVILEILEQSLTVEQTFVEIVTGEQTHVEVVDVTVGQTLVEIITGK